MLLALTHSLHPIPPLHPTEQAQWQTKQNLARQPSTNTLMPPTFLLLFLLKHLVLLGQKHSIFSGRFPNASELIPERPYPFNILFKGSRLLSKEVMLYLFWAQCSNFQSPMTLFFLNVLIILIILFIIFILFIVYIYIILFNCNICVHMLNLCI